MSKDDTDRDSIRAQRKELADTFGTDTDPLAKYVDQFEALEIDPLQMYVDDVVKARGVSQSRQNDFERVYRQYKEFMANRRPPACPTEDDIEQFAIHQKESRGKKVRQVKADLRMLERAYEYWQDKSEFPHPTNYNPIVNAQKKIPFRSYSSDEPEKEFPWIPIDELRQRIQNIKHVRDRAIIGTQFKLGGRVGEITEMRLSDIHIQHSQLQDHYPELGAHPRIEHEDAVLIPDKDARDRNKSSNHRILPIDDELRKLLLQYLLIRPDNDEPWVFLSQERNAKLWPKRINEMWHDAFRPEYAETETHKPVTSHYGRHYFTTYWKIKQGVDRELTKYMRGDELKEEDKQNEAIDSYLHTKYEDIEDLYRKNIFKFGI